MAASNSVFISYRRAVGFAWARLVWQDLADHGIDAFLDLESLRDAGHFDEKILNQIEARPYFVPVLAPGSLERCVDDDDWLRREIDFAASRDRSIIPLIVDGFDLADADRFLPNESAVALRNSNGVGLVAEYFAEGMRRLREDRLKEIELPVRDLSDADLAFADEARRRAIQVDLPPPSPRGTPVPPPPPVPLVGDHPDASTPGGDAPETDASGADTTTSATPTEEPTTTEPPDTVTTTSATPTEEPTTTEPPESTTTSGTSTAEPTTEPAGTETTESGTPSAEPPESEASRSEPVGTETAIPVTAAIPVTPAPPDDEPRTGPGSTGRPSTRTRAAIAIAAALIVIVGALALLNLARDDGEVADPGAAAEVTTHETDDDTDDAEGDAVDATTSPSSSIDDTDDDESLGSVLAVDRGVDDGFTEGQLLRSDHGGHEFGMVRGGALLAATDGDPWREQPAIDDDGELIGGGSVWSMQSDGNLVLYRDGVAIWDSQTNVDGADEVQLMISDDDGVGVLEISVDDEAVWTCRSDDCPVDTAEDTDPPPDDEHDDTVTTRPPPPSTSPTTAPNSTNCAGVVMPAVLGLDRATATELLESEGLEVRVRSNQDGTVPEDAEVIDSSVAAGTCVDEGSMIVLVLAP